MASDDTIRKNDPDCFGCKVVTSCACFGVSIYVLNSIRLPIHGPISRRFFGACSVGEVLQMVLGENYVILCFVGLIYLGIARWPGWWPFKK